MGGDEAALHQIAALNEALTLAVSLLRVAVGAVRSKRTGQPFRSPAVRGWKVCRMHGASERRVMLATLALQPHPLAAVSVVVQFRERKLIIEPHFAGLKSLL
jgi:hypothetical protein